ncbi:hypothetical protein V8G54_035777, partial [Vigna mungo]
VPETLSTEERIDLRAPPKSEFKAFLDSTKFLWKAQMLASKPAGIFYATSFQGGGQKTAALTAITQSAHHGMIFVPIVYTFGSGMFEMSELKDGSPYTGDGSRNPTGLQLQQAFNQGKHIVSIAKQLKEDIDIHQIFKLDNRGY